MIRRFYPQEPFTPDRQYLYEAWRVVLGKVARFGGDGPPIMVNEGSAGERPLTIEVAVPMFERRMADRND